MRYGENPHQAAGLYRATGIDLAPGTFSRGALLLQGKPLSYNNILDTAAATGLARDLRGSACVIVKHANPCGAAEAADLLEAWVAALAGDPISAFGGVVAVTEPVDAALAERLTSIFLEVVAAPACSPAALEILARKPNLRVLLDPGLGSPPCAGLEMRSAGGAVLVTTADVAADDAANVEGRHSAPTERRGEGRSRPRLARVPARQVERDRAGQRRSGRRCGRGPDEPGRQRPLGGLRRPDPNEPPALRARRTRSTRSRTRWRSCTAAGVTAFVQPGGSQRDAEVISAADAAGATMLLTGVRHFRH